jgi:hypothetical protein
VIFSGSMTVIILLLFSNVYFILKFSDLPEHTVIAFLKTYIHKMIQLKPCRYLRCFSVLASCKIVRISIQFNYLDMLLIQKKEERKNTQFLLVKYFYLFTIVSQAISLI